MRRITRLIATGPLTYATRRLQAGDAFDADPRHAGVLTTLGKARNADDAPPELPVARSAPSVEAPAKRTRTSAAEMDSLRAEYKRATGEDAPQGWPAARLRKHLAGIDASDANNGGEDGTSC